MFAQSSPSSTITSIGIEAFDMLRAEAEPWLAQVFEPPSEFDLVSGPRSCIIFGNTGSGRSAIYQALLHLMATGGYTPQRLIAEWHPRLPSDSGEPGAAHVKRQVHEIFDACAFSTLRYLAEQPALFQAAPRWAQRNLHWFTHRYLRGDFEMRTGMLQQQVGTAGQTLLAQLMLKPERELFVDEPAHEEVMAQLIAALKTVSLQGVWVLLDQGEVEAEESELVVPALRAFLSRLNLFEQEGFTYKIFLPLALRAQLSNVSAIERRRLNVHYLQWNSEKLSALLVKRVALAVGNTFRRLDQICTDEHLVKWLERSGGLQPRGWLEQFRPLAAAYLERHRQGQTAPISPEEWQEIRRRHPPRLAFDRQQKIVRVEERKIDLTDEQFKIFNYLYEHPGEICSRSQLYYLAYRGLEREARTPADENYEAPADYRGLIETAIWRLRQSIEPYGGEETFIVTIKGKGYRLDHT